MKPVYSSLSLVEAHHLKNLLQSAGIRCRLKNEELVRKAHEVAEQDHAAPLLDVGRRDAAPGRDRNAADLLHLGLDPAQVDVESALAVRGREQLPGLRADEPGQPRPLPQELRVVVRDRSSPAAEDASGVRASPTNFPFKVAAGMNRTCSSRATIWLQNSARCRPKALSPAFHFNSAGALEKTPEK